MFSVLSVRPRVPSNARERLLLRCRRDRVEAQIVRREPLRFWEIVWERTGRREPPWREIGALASWAPSGLLLPKGLTPPDGCGVHSVECAGLSRALLCRAAVQAAAGCGAPRGTLRVCVFDPLGNLGETVEALRTFGEVRVTGGGDVRESSGCAMLLAPDGISGAPLSEQLVFAPAPENSPASPWQIVECLPALTLAGQRLCPPGIEPEAFAAALYETGQFGNGWRTGLCRSADGRQFGVNDAANMLAARVASSAAR